MIYRSKAPLRIGLAGGGTDVSPYSDLYGGEILNATISLFARVTIEQITADHIIVERLDLDEKEKHQWCEYLPIKGKSDLVAGVYNRIQKDYGIKKGGLRISTSMDVLPGSGLGTSSTMVVCIIGAFMEMLKIRLTNYELAHYAYQIEREDLQLPGGKQDQYAAMFGGINHMKFSTQDKVSVKPLDIKPEYLYELENNLLLYFTATTREGGVIINEQVKNVKEQNEKSIEAMHHLKEQVVMLKHALLKGNLNQLGAILDFGFTNKKLMAHNISNNTIDEIYAAAKKSGATGGKISGAGGGGFMILYCPGNVRHKVIKTLKVFGGEVKNYTFIKEGLTTWTV